MGKNVIVKYKVALNNCYGISAMSNSDCLGNDTILKSAKIMSKIVASRDGFLYADTDGTYVRDLDKNKNKNMI